MKQILEWAKLLLVSILLTVGGILLTVAMLDVMTGTSAVPDATAAIASYLKYRDVVKPRCPIAPPNPNPVFPPYDDDDVQHCWEGCRMRPHACPLRGVRLDYEWTGNGWELTCVCLRDCDFYPPHPQQLQMT